MMQMSLLPRLLPEISANMSNYDAAHPPPLSTLRILSNPFKYFLLLRVAKFTRLIPTYNPTAVGASILLILRLLAHPYFLSCGCWLIRTPYPIRRLLSHPYFLSYGDCYLIHTSYPTATAISSILIFLRQLLSHPYFLSYDPCYLIHTSYLTATAISSIYFLSYDY